jgi:hypothetical protein
MTHLVAEVVLSSHTPFLSNSWNCCPPLLRTIIMHRCYTGEEVSSSDAHVVADLWGMDYRFWAISWLCLSCVLTLVGIVFAFDARETRHTNGLGGRDGMIIDAEVTAVPYSPPPPPTVASSGSRRQQQQSSLPIAVPSGAAAQGGSASGKTKRNWFGFLRREKKYHQATLY